MREEKLNFGIIIRIGISLLPLLFGYSLPAVIWCAFNIAMSFIAYGPMTSFVSSLCAVCISMFFCGLFGEGAKLEGLFISLQAILCAAACIYTVAGKKKFFSGVWLASIGYLIPSFLSAKNAASHFGQSVAQYLTELPFQMSKAEIMAGLGDPSLEMYAGEIERILGHLHNSLMLLVPATLIISSVVVGYIIMWCVAARIRSLPIKFDHSFSEIKIPRLMILFVAVSLILTLADFGKLSAISFNVFVVLLSFLFFAGVSFTEYFMRKKIKSGFPRVVIHIAIFFSLSAIAGFAYILITILDAFCDFRKIKKRGHVCETEEG